MRDKDKSKAQLISELRELRKQLDAQQPSAWSDKVDSAPKPDELIAALRQSRKDLSDSRKENAASKKELTESQEARHISEQSLSETNKRFNILGDLIPFGVWTADAQGHITFLSDSFLEMSGISSEEIARMEWVDQLVRPKVVNAISDWNSSLYERDIWEREFTITSKNGRQYDILIRGVPLLDKDEKLLSWLGINLDISKRKRMEQELIQAQKMESAGRLAAGIAHDFNNMLSVILGNTELGLQKTDSTQPLHDNLQGIRNAAQRSTNIVRQLLAFASKQTIAPKVLDLNETVEEMRKILRRLIGEYIELSWKPDHDIWPVKMDPGQVDQILTNLSVNARDAIDGVGKLTIETGKVSFDEAHCAKHPYLVPGDFVLLAISDDGCGMDKKTLKNIFEPFFTTKGVGQGTGLGLATVYGIVKQNNGFINVYSEPNQGTTFRIYLPRHHTVDEPVRGENINDFEAHGNETILLVDDEATILKMTRVRLERLGYTVLTATTPGEAMEVAKEHGNEIHLLITDVVMPEMNGRELAEKLLSIYPNLKWLLMSGYTKNTIAHHGVLDEGVQFMQKPFSTQELSIHIRKVLDKSN